MKKPETMKIEDETPVMIELDIVHKHLLHNYLIECENKYVDGIAWLFGRKGVLRLLEPDEGDDEKEANNKKISIVNIARNKKEWEVHMEELSKKIRFLREVMKNAPDPIMPLDQ